MDTLNTETDPHAIALAFAETQLGEALAELQVCIEDTDLEILEERLESTLAANRTYRVALAAKTAAEARVGGEIPG